MKKFTKLLSLLIALTMIFLSGCTENKTDNTNQTSKDNANKIIVMTSLFPIYDFTRNIGGEYVDVENIIPLDSEGHNSEINPSQIAKLQKAKAFIHTGTQMQPWIEQIKKSNENKDLLIVDTTKGLDMIKGHFHHHHDDGDEDEEREMTMDPHVWLSLKNAQMQCKNILDALVQIDPSHKAQYEKNYNEYILKLQDLDKKYLESTKEFKNRNLVVNHEAFGYLCRDYNLNQKGIEGVFAESEPDIAQMKEIIDFVKSNKVKVIYFENLASPKVAETIANETGAKTDVLNPCEAISKDDLKNGKSYLDIMNENLDTLIKGQN